MLREVYRTATGSISTECNKIFLRSAAIAAPIAPDPQHKLPKKKAHLYAIRLKKI